MDFNLNFHPLDNLIKDKTSFWLEALVPFVDYKYKKYLILYIKYKEITAIMEALEDTAYVESCGFNCKAHSIDDVINGLTGFMPRDFSENIIQMKSMIDMMNMMNSMDNGGANMNQFMNIHKPPQNQYSSDKNANYYKPHQHSSTQENDDLFENIKLILDQEQ